MLKGKVANLRGRADPSCARGAWGTAATLGSWKTPIKKEKEKKKRKRKVKKKEKRKKNLPLSPRQETRP